MLTLTDPREAKLPKWAQDLLKHMRFRVAEAEKSAEQARYATDPDGSDVVIHPYSDVPVGLGRGARVRFKLDVEQWVDVEVASYGRGLALHGSEPLAIRPQITNHLYIAIARDL